MIPKENFHQFRVSHPENYIRCILAFQDRNEILDLTYDVMDAVKVLSKPDEKISGVFSDLIEITKSNLSDKEKELYINSALAQLLIFLKLKPVKEINNKIHLSPIVSKALYIIDKGYAENLSVKNIAELLYASPSTLSHKFSAELNISIYRYVTKKRLSVAHNLIQNVIWSSAKYRRPYYV